MAEDGVLQFSDVAPLLTPPPMGLDPVTQDSLMTFRRRIFQMRLKKVNKNFQFLSDSWPDGRPIDYFIALELCSDDMSSLSEKIKTSKFTRRVLSESAQRGFPIRSHSSQKQSTGIYSDFVFDDPGSDEILTPGRRGRGRKKKKDPIKWTDSEINEFIYEYNNNIANQSWSAFCSRFFGKREEDCFKLLKRLKKEGKIFVEAPEATARQVEAAEEKASLLAINFIKGDRRVHVGPISKETEAKMAMNPIPGYIDMITQKTMEIPALSPDGYVLDYSTWLKLLNEKKVNPFTQNHLTSKRQLVLLTIDNFEQYKESIVNLDECKPQK